MLLILVLIFGALGALGGMQFGQPGWGALIGAAIPIVVRLIFGKEGLLRFISR